MRSSFGEHDSRILISEGGRAHINPRRKEGPETGVRLFPDESTNAIESGIRSMFSEEAIEKYCCIDIDFDILERQEDNLERQKDNSKRRDDNGKDYGRRERPTVVLCLQLILLYKL